jgi:hypothetical protein
MVQANLDKLSNDEIKDTHWMPEGLYRRFVEYDSKNSLDNFRAYNKGEDVPIPTIRFF